MTFIPVINFMAAGFLSGLISSGGDLGQGIIGAFSAGVFHGIGTHFGDVSKLSVGMRTAKVLAHGVAGGAMSVLRGGKFRDGFLSAGASQLAAVTGTYERFGIRDNPTGTAGFAKNAAASAILGGSVSALSGGKFANGAVTAAFSRMFNDVSLHNAEPKNVIATWLRGNHGGETFDFLPGSKISELFAQGNGAKYFEDWIYSEYGDSPLKELL